MNPIWNQLLNPILSLNFWTWLSSATFRLSNWSQKYWDQKECAGPKNIYCLLPSPLCDIFYQMGPFGPRLKTWIKMNNFLIIEICRHLTFGVTCIDWEYFMQILGNIGWGLCVVWRPTVHPPQQPLGALKLYSVLAKTVNIILVLSTF